jgi:hypothetical protein
MPIPLADQISELKRELAMRKHVYPGLVARDKLTEYQATLQNDRLQAALETLQAVKRAVEPELGL